MFPVVVLVGGLATRIRPITEKIPKALIKINNRPFIDYQLDLLRSNGIKEIVLCVGFLGEKIQEHVQTLKLNELMIQFSFDGEHLLGTGGAIKKALPMLGDRFFILYGDSYLPINYELIEEAYKRSQKSGLMTVFHNNGRWDTSNVIYLPAKIKNVPGRVMLYDKKSPTAEMRYIDYGLSCCEAAEISKEKGDCFDLAEVFKRLSQEGQLAGVEITERFYEIGSFCGIHDFKNYLRA